GRVHVLDDSGHELPGWPFSAGALAHIAKHRGQPAFVAGGIDPHVLSPILATPAVGDIDGDGKPEIVVATRGGEIWALRKDATPLPGFPIQIDTMGHPVQDPHTIVDVGFFSSPVLYDLDGDRKAEIVIGAYDGKLYAFHGNGQPADGFPV